MYQITSDTVFALLLSVFIFNELGLVKQWCTYGQLLLEWGPHTLYPYFRVKNVCELLLDWGPHMLNTSSRGVNIQEIPFLHNVDHTYGVLH